MSRSSRCSLYDDAGSSPTLPASRESRQPVTTRPPSGSPPPSLPFSLLHPRVRTDHPTDAREEEEEENKLIVK